MLKPELRGACKNCKHNSFCPGPEKIDSANRRLEKLPDFVKVSLSIKCDKKEIECK